MLSNCSSAKLPFLVLLWYISNALASYLTKHALSDAARPSPSSHQHGPSSSISIDDTSLVLYVSLIQLILSGILGLTYTHLRGESLSPWSSYWASLRGEDAQFFRLMTSIGMCNAVGLVATNIGYLYGSVSLVQLIKAMEPVATFVFDILLLKSGKTHSLTTAAGVVLVIAGASYASYLDPTFNTISIVAACISNAVLPLRNIFVKYYDETREADKKRHGHGHNMSGIVLFSLVSMIGAFMVGMLFLGTLALHSTIPAVSSLSFMSALAYYGYNVFSFSVLHLVDPVLHAVLNVIKRAFVIVTSMVVFGQTPSLRFWLALFVMTVGLFVYLIGKKKINTDPFQRMFRGMYKNGRYVLQLVLVLVLLTSQELQVLPLLSYTVFLGGSQSPQLSATAVQSYQQYSLQDIVAVPLEPYNACGDRILHVSCLKTIIIGGAVDIASPLVPIVSSLYPQLCNDLVQQTNDPSTKQLDVAHCMLCLQVNGEVSALAEATKAKDNINRYLLPTEASRVAAAIVPSVVTHRIVDRKTISMQPRYRPFSWKHNAERAKESNFGNLIWQYGATRLINPFTTLFVSQESSWAAGALVLASANALRLDEPSPEMESMFITWQKRIRSLDVPTIFLGIGIQKSFSSDFAAADLRLLEFQRAVFQEIEKRQTRPAVAVRGNLTCIACENSGLSHCITMGCPSLTINTVKNLGATMDRKWKITLNKLAKGETVKMVLALPVPGPTVAEQKDRKKVMDLFVKLAKVHEAVIVIQDGNDSRLMKESGMLEQARSVSFNNVEQWFNLTANVDLVLSARIHGGMAGIASATPTVVIPMDLRIQELVDDMLIPSLPLERVNSGMDLGTLLRQADVNFEAFEANRRERILQYIGILREADLEMNPKLLDVIKGASDRELYE